jgi:hypothetical protein
LQDFNKKIPREEVEAIFEKVRTVVEALDESYVVTACGSFRLLNILLCFISHFSVLLVIVTKTMHKQRLIAE